jgi:hypothetical protein
VSRFVAKCVSVAFSPFFGTFFAAAYTPATLALFITDQGLALQIWKDFTTEDLVGVRWSPVSHPTVHLSSNPPLVIQPSTCHPTAYLSSSPSLVTDESSNLPLVRLSFTTEDLVTVRWSLLSHQAAFLYTTMCARAKEVAPTILPRMFSHFPHTFLTLSKRFFYFQHNVSYLFVGEAFVP